MKCNWRALVIFLSYAVQLMWAVKQKRIFITEIGQCPGKDNLPVYLQRVNISRHNNQYIFNTFMHLNESVRNGYNLKISLSNCSSATEVVDCKIAMKNFITIDVCSMLKTNALLFKSFYESAKPRPSCPLVSRYHLENVQVLNTLVNSVPMALKTFYKINMTGYDRIHKSRLVACTYALFHIGYA